jgi:hypothetical protein
MSERDERTTEEVIDCGRFMRWEVPLGDFTVYEGRWMPLADVPPLPPRWQRLPDFTRLPLVATVRRWCPPTVDTDVEVPRFLDQLEGCLDARTDEARALAAQQLIDAFRWFLPVEGIKDRGVRRALRRRRKVLELEGPEALPLWLSRDVLPPALCDAIADGDREQRVSDARGRRLKVARGVHLWLDGTIVHSVRGSPLIVEPLVLPLRWVVPWLRRKTLEFAGYRIIAQAVEDYMSRRFDRPWSEIGREPNWHECDPAWRVELLDVLEGRAPDDAETALLEVATEVAGDPELLAHLTPADRLLCQAFREGWQSARIMAFLGLRPEQYRQRKKRLFQQLHALRARA